MKKDQVALTPPMGWNSWDCYGPAVNEEQLSGQRPDIWRNHLEAVRLGVCGVRHPVG